MAEGKKVKRSTTDKSNRRKRKPNQNISSQKKAAAKARYIKRKKKEKTKRLIKEMVLTLIVTCFILVGVFFVFFTGRTVNSFDMIPTLKKKDNMLIERRASIERFDIVCVDTKNKLNRDYGFYRIIGLPGEVVVYRNDQLMIDNQNIDEFYLKREVNSEDEENNFTPNFSSYDMKKDGKIPKNYYLVLGDNRPYSIDSRNFGLVHKDKFIGKVRD